MRSPTQRTPERRERTTRWEADPEVRDLIAARRRGRHCPTGEFALSTHEAARLIYGSLTYRDQTTEELERVIAWAAQARVDGWLLEMALDGEISAVVQAGEILFALPEQPIEMLEVDR